MILAATSEACSLLARALFLPVFVSLFLATGVAVADDRAAAQELFDAAREAMKNGRYEDACPKLEAAAQLSRTAGVRLNLADCYDHIGRTASAWARFEEALGIAEREGDAVASEAARKGREALRPRLSFLTVVVTEKTARLAGLEITRDGIAMPSAAWNAAIPVDPGTHAIAASAPGHAAWRSAATLGGAGSREKIEVPILSVQRVADAAKRAPFTGPEDGARQRVVAYSSGGLGVVGLGFGTAFARATIASKNEYESHRASNGACLDIRCEKASRAAHTSGDVATVCFAAGAALVATGVLLYLTAPRGNRVTQATRAAPALGTF